MRSFMLWRSLRTFMQPSAEAVYRKPLCHTAAVTRSACASSLACTGDSSPPLPIAHDLWAAAHASQRSRPCMQPASLPDGARPSCMQPWYAALEPKQVFC